MQRYIAILLVIILQFAAAGAVRAAYQVSLNASASEETVKLGEVFVYRLVVSEFGETDKITRLMDPDFGNLIVEGSSRKASTRVLGGKASRETTVTFALYANEPGEYTIKPVEFLLQDPRSGARQEMVSNPVTVTVLDEKPGLLDDIRDIREPKTFLDRVKRMFYIAVGLGALFAVLFAAVIVWAVRRRRNRPVLKSTTPAVSPRDAALESLRLAESLMSDPREFYTAVTDALRVYLRDARGMHAPEATTSELVRMCRGSGMKPEVVEEVRALFIEADLVKFARYLPAADRMRADLERARRLVGVL